MGEMTMLEATRMRLPEPPETNVGRQEDAALAFARAEAELLRIAVEMARVQTVTPAEPQVVHDLSPLGQRLFAR